MSKRKSFNINITERRKFLIIRISKENIVMRPYINCFKSKTPKYYRVSKSSGIYNHCFSANRNNYNLVIIESDWKRINKKVIRF